jgi:hypothetical protein
VMAGISFQPQPEGRKRPFHAAYRGVSYTSRCVRARGNPLNHRLCSSGLAGGRASARSVPPEILEPRRAQRRVARGMRDGDVAQPVLDRAGVDAVIGEL